LKELNKTNIKGLDKKGVYKIYFYQNDKPTTICRIAKKDTSGLIYIGCTQKQNFEKRLGNFILSWKKDKTNNHSAGNKINKIKKLKNLFESGVLMYEVIESIDPLLDEANMIYKYINEFGEKPPLNG